MITKTLEVGIKPTSELSVALSAADLAVVKRITELLPHAALWEINLIMDTLNKINKRGRVVMKVHEEGE